MATFFVQEVYRVTGIGSVTVGRVEKGILKTGMKANINGKIIEIKSIEKNHQAIAEAKEGENVGINVKVISPSSQESFFKRLFSRADDGYSIIKDSLRRSIEFA